MRGKLGHTIDSGTLCFRTYKNFGIQVIKNPARKKDPAGMMWLYKHQIYYWSMHWNFLTAEQKAAYVELGEAAGITGYDYYIKEKYDPKYLYIHPSDLNWTEKAYPNKHFSPGESVHMSDDVTYESHVYVKFPLEMLSSNLSFMWAQLKFFYYEEAGWDADDKIVDCYRITEDWDWRTLTWNNAPATPTPIVAWNYMPGQMQWFHFYVQGPIQSAVNYPDTWFGFKIRFRTLDPTTESMSGLRATLPHDNDFWPYLKLRMY